MYKKEIPADSLNSDAPRISVADRMENNDRPQENQTDELARLEQQLAEEKERCLRLAADFDNFRKRTAREMEQRAASQKEALVRDVLPAIDNLERALVAKRGEELREGVKMIHEPLLAAVKRHGFEPRHDLGQAFDGRFHDGIAVGCKPEMPEHSVIEVWERGWMRGNEMFRPAKVLVNKLQAEGADGLDREVASAA